ncbi:HalOD1 output domain-containing protein [Halegenticoccus tardaugens]|uniref:HalOD1 output domain-containing protein n=1 Tax=Halegenticoccus tardaugens TaxID=2071624 RepID=UPI0013E90BBA|nr:HalOD1 output domain-containing protein [Halegenticoccus tardaugens]
MPPAKSDTEAHHFSYAEEGEVSVDVVTAVAEVIGDDPLEMKPLRDVLDPDALDELIRSMADTEGTVSFELAGCEVSVRGDGGIVVYDDS